LAKSLKGFGEEEKKKKQQEQKMEKENAFRIIMSTF